MYPSNNKQQHLQASPHIKNYSSHSDQQLSRNAVIRQHGGTAENYLHPSGLSQQQLGISNSQIQIS